MAVKTQTVMLPQQRIKKGTLFDLALAGAVALIALALRAFGLDWGLPNPQNVHSYHPDEITPSR